MTRISNRTSFPERRATPVGVMLAAALLFVMGCSTEKNKFMNRTYHNTTARYNGYFNAKETIKEALIDFHAQHKDDYTKILPVFIIPDENNSKSLYSSMDRAIDKTSTVIKRHSMPDPEKNRNKKQEWCKWIDDNWLVMGQAYYYKRDLQEAKQRFDYVSKYYGNLPIKYEGQLWLARTNMELNDMLGAQKYLDRLQLKKEESEDKSKPKKQKSRSKKRSRNSRFQKNENEDPDFPTYISDDLEMTWADFYIRKKEYDKAIDHLETALQIVRKKADKARISFILAQLYQRKGDNGSAIFYYTRVDKLNPEYEMEFYSRIFRALITDGNNMASLKKRLLKMVKDDKNKEYLDQIYYALGDIELRAENRAQGVSYMNKSIQASTTNNRQKGVSYMRLGDLYYGEKNFVQSKAYYDSTMLNLPTDFEGYQKVQDRAEGLKSLVENLLVIMHEDSVQRLARMETRDLEKYLDKIIKQQDEEEERKRIKELNAQNSTATPPPLLGSGDNKWYWWNAQSIQQGVNDFKKVWGSRKLEDNWRRSDKTSTLEFIDPNGDTTQTVSTGDDPLKRREAMMKKLPLTEEQMAASQERLSEALFQAGTIYKEKLNEWGLSAKTLKRFVKDYPEHEQVLPAYYLLYRIYSEKDPSQAEEYKQYILKNYPESDYANIIRNPNYLREQAEKLKQDERSYEDAFARYKKKDMTGCIDLCSEVINSGSKHPIMPRFYFLRSVAYGNLQQYEDMEKSLAELVNKYPNEDISKQAMEILEILRNKNSIDAARSGKSTYIHEPNEEHFFVLVFPNTLGSVNDAKAKVSDLNLASFSNDNLKITNSFIDLDNQVIMVKSFPNKEKAMNYYVAFGQDDKVKSLNTVTTFFVITNKNYAAFYLRKKTDEYLKFFEENYK